MTQPTTQAEPLTAEELERNRLWNRFLSVAQNHKMDGDAIRAARSAIESEARSQVIRELRERVEGLSDVNSTPTLHTGRDTDWPMVKRAAVLAIFDESAPTGGTEA